MFVQQVLRSESTREAARSPDHHFKFTIVLGHDYDSFGRFGVGRASQGGVLADTTKLARTRCFSASGLERGEIKVPPRGSHRAGSREPDGLALSIRASSSLSLDSFFSESATERCVSAVTRDYPLILVAQLGRIKRVER